MIRLRALFIFVLIAGPGGDALAQQACNQSRSLPEFVDCEVTLVVRRGIADNDQTKQAEENSAGQNSSALANSSSAPDVVGISLNPAVFATKSRSSNSTDFSATVNLYALYSAEKKTNPYDQAIYDNKYEWRRLSFNIGRSYPEDNAATAAQGSSTYQAKYLVAGSRDVGDPANRKLLADLPGALSASMVDYANIYSEVEAYVLGIYKTEMNGAAPPSRSSDQMRAFIAGLSGDSLREVQRIIGTRVESQANLFRVTKSAVDKITRRTQISVDFTSRISKGTGSNLYRSEAIFDRPLFWKFSSTANLSYDFQNAQTSTSVNRQIGRIAEAVKFPVASSEWLPTKAPPSITVSGEADFGSHGTPIYKGQFKLSIPVLSGLDLPISFLYVNRTATVPRADIKAQLGLAIDTSKLARAFVGK